MTRYLDTVPHPWTREVVNTAIFKSFSDARESIDETSGGKLWLALHDLEDTLWIFESSTTDLLDEICIFGDRSRNPSFWHANNTGEAENHTRAVKKKLFQCTSSLMALVDHARNFQNATPVEGYSERVKQTFAPPGLHDFLQCLRNYNTHWRMAQANWVIQHSSQPPAREARFQVFKTELLRWDGWTAKAHEFIESSEDAVDVYELFSAYRRHVQSFYSWHKGAVLDQHAQVLRPYLEYKRLYEGLLKKYNWNMVISHVPKTLNPYQYLSQYLTTQQVERLLVYEHRSEEQVDALIRMLDMEEFCDESLRQKILLLFQLPA